MYELFVLGELMDGPLHGYLLHSIVSTAIGPLRQMSWGALYPLIRRLEQEGLIAPEPDQNQANGGRQRKVYGITDAGRARFLDLMLKPAEYNVDYADLFAIKLSSFHHLTPEQQDDVLRQYQSYVRFMLDHLQSGRRYIAGHSEILEAERPHILRTIDHRLHLFRADREWIDAEIARGETAREDESMSHQQPTNQSGTSSREQPASCEYA